MNKITIIGSGSVGATIAYTLTISGIASEIVMIDINGEKALGEALDIRQGTPFCTPTNIYAGTYDDAEGSDIVINSVVAVGKEDGIVAGAPYVEGASVAAKVIKNGKNKKITVFTYRPKKDSKRKMGHRQPYTKIQIMGINA